MLEFIKTQSIPGKCQFGEEEVFFLQNHCDSVRVMHFNDYCVLRPTVAINRELGLEVIRF